MSGDLGSDAFARSADVYLVAWESVRRWRRAAAISLVALVPTVLLAGLLKPYPAAGMLPLTAVATFIYATARLWLFPCPRCHELFHMRDWYRNPSIYREVQCPHCRIEIGTPKG